MDSESHLNRSSQEAAAMPKIPGSRRQASDSSSASNTQASSCSPSPDLSDADTAVDSFFDQKKDEILHACKWRHVGSLRSLAERRGGLLNDPLRRLAWPLLLGLDLPSTSDRGAESGRDDLTGPADPPAEPVKWEDLPRHRDEDQVQLDVDRSFVHYPKNKSDHEMSLYKSELSALIKEVLRRYPFLCYFQGYHDICQVLLLVLRPTWRAPTVARLSILRIRDFMLPTMTPTTTQLHLIPDIISHADPKLRQHLADILPFFAITDLLTMYAHDMTDYKGIARLFDALLAREPVFSIYLFAQIIIDRRDDIFDIDEPDMLHVFLSKIPTKIDLDQLVVDSCRLFDDYPPETLRSWRRISSMSALKTARSVDDCANQTLDDGKRMFQKQAQEIERAELYARVKATIWAYRSSAKAIGLAVAVGALAFYLRRNPSIVTRLVTMFSQ